MTIDILLSTYNGERFVEELLQSLKRQSFSDWHLLVRDDGSEDNTVEILNAFREKEQKRVTFIKDDKKNLGPKNSFEVLLRSSNADYIMFCDQDDVWMKDKIQRTWEKIKELEQQSPGIPALVFTDLTVTDEKLNVLDSSFWKYTKVNPGNIKNIYSLLINNPVVGCTVMINRVAKLLVLPFPEQALMHDRWMALKVVQEGVADYYQEPTVLYRVHEENSIGVEAFDKGYVLQRALRVQETLARNFRVFRMARSLKNPPSFLKFAGYKIFMTLSRIFK